MGGATSWATFLQTHLVTLLCMPRRWSIGIVLKFKGREIDSCQGKAVLNTERKKRGRFVTKSV
jgi:hypothetical protein